MAARGTEAKTEIFAKVMKTFPNAFWEDEGKVLRIPFSEGGNLVEVKMTLTAAKNILGGEMQASAFQLKNAPNPTPTNSAAAAAASMVVDTRTDMEMTQAEKNNVASLMKALGL